MGVISARRLRGVRLTENRTLTPAPHAKAHSVPGTSRKDPRVRLSVRTSYRMRFSVQHGLQNALFRRVRFSSPAQTPTRLTQKRILAVGPHAKAHSVPDGLRKGALYVIDTMRNALFGNVATTECAFPYSTGCRMRFSVECAFPHLRRRRPASRTSAF